MAALHITDADFQKEVLQSQTPVLVDFWAEWCEPCKMVGPVVEELSQEYNGRVKFVKVDVDANQESPSQFGVMSIPTLIIFKDGQPVKTLIGARPKDEFKKNLDEVLSS